MQMLFKTYDVDGLSRPGTVPMIPGVSIQIQSDWQTYRRYRPDYVAATDRAVWDKDYYNPTAAVPWAGFVVANDALVLQDNLTLVSNHVLIGRALMYPVEVFPYPKDDMVISQADNGQWWLDRPDEVLLLKGTTLSLVVDGWRIYGHWLVDMLPKLERAQRSEIHIDQYLLPTPSKSWQLAMLDAIGLPRDRCVFVDLAKTAVKCDRLVIPTSDRFNSEIRPDFIRAHERLRLRYAADIVPDVATRNLFVTHDEAVRLLMNRTEVERLAADMGFEIVRLDTMTLPEQIRLFASARSIMGECGSALNNAVFSLPGTHIAVIQNAEHPDHLQAQIAFLKGQNIFYALGEPAGDRGAFHVQLAYVRAVAERLLARPVTRDVVPRGVACVDDKAQPQSRSDGRPRDPARPLFFMHVPKAAGTSLRRALKDTLQPDVVVNTFDGCLSGAGELALTPTKPDVALDQADMPDAGLIAAHMGVGTAVSRYPDAQRFTALRVPEVRLVSHWLYWRTIGDKDLIFPEDQVKIPLARGTLEAFVMDERLAFELDNVAVRMLLWPDPRIAPDRWIGAEGEQLLDTALDHLSEFDHIDVVENGRFVENLSEWLNLPIALNHLNETPYLPDNLCGVLADELTPATLHQISRLTRLDRKLWDYTARSKMSLEAAEALRSATMMVGTLRHQALLQGPSLQNMRQTRTVL